MRTGSEREGKMMLFDEQKLGTSLNKRVSRMVIVVRGILGSFNDA